MTAYRRLGLSVTRLHSKDVAMRAIERRAGAKLALGVGAIFGMVTCACASVEVLCEKAPMPDCWVFHDKKGRLRLDVCDMDGEHVLRVTDPGGEQPGASAWSLESRTFAIRPQSTLQLAVRLVSPAPEFGGAFDETHRTGICWLDADGREIGFRTMSFPRSTRFLRTYVRRYRIPEDAVAAYLSFGFKSPQIPVGEAFALASVYARLLEPGESASADSRYEKTSVPRLKLLTDSPCEDSSAPITLEMASRHPIDWTSFVCSVDGKPAPERVRRDGNRIFVLPPDGKAWNVPSFPEVSVAGVDLKGTRFADSRVCCFGSRLKEDLVALRDDGVVTIGGRPFFPIGIFGMRCLKPEDEAALRRVRTAKFNTVQSYIGGLDDLDWFLSAADRFGLKAVVEPAARNVCSPRDVLQTAYALRSHKSLLSWYLGDDSATHQSAFHLRQVDAYVKAVDNGHISSHSDSVVWGDKTLSRTTRFVGGTDVFIPQLYPAMKAVPTERDVPEISRDLSIYKKELAAAGNPLTSIWPVLQAFKGYGSWPRYPTLAEQRVSAWLAIVRGARGLMWYLYHASGEGNVGLTDDPELWRTVTDVVAEVDRYKDDLVTRDADVQPVVEVVEGAKIDGLGFPAVVALLKEGVGSSLLIVVNSSSRAVKVRLSVDGRPLLDDLALEARGVRLLRPRQGK